MMTMIYNSKYVYNFFVEDDDDVGLADSLDHWNSHKLHLHIPILVQESSFRPGETKSKKKTIVI